MDRTSATVIGGMVKVGGKVEVMEEHRLAVRISTAERIADPKAPEFFFGSHAVGAVYEVVSIRQDGPYVVVTAMTPHGLSTVGSKMVRKVK